MEKELLAILEPYIEQFSGSCMVASGNRVLVSLSNGLANRDFAIPNRLDTKFDTASVTKAFTAVATLTLVDKGLLSLADFIAEIVDLSGTKIDRRITIEHLLTHTSGMGDDADEESGEDYAALFANQPNYAIRCCRDFLPNFAYKEPYFEPGANIRYNNCAFILLGLAMEKLTDKDSRDYIMEAVFRPAHMDNTIFCAKDEMETGRAEGYAAQKDADGKIIKWIKNIYAYPPIGTPDGGAYTTVADLEKFFRALISKSLLSEEMVEAVLRPHSPLSRNHRLGTWKTGYGFEFILCGNDIFCMYKEGVNAGVGAITAFFPAFDITVHMLANQDGSMWDMYGGVRDFLHNKLWSQVS